MTPYQRSVFQRRPRWFTQEMLVGVIILAVLFLFFGLAIYSAANCLRWEETGATQCHMNGHTLYCQPVQECVEWKE